MLASEAPPMQDPPGSNSNSYGPESTHDPSGGICIQHFSAGGHHLLKHCLSDGQRVEALAHFGTGDVKEAAKEISRMGQRELQTKFKLVYGTTTHSNNNDWLRRKLYEAVGAAPVKATTKTKPRKPSTPKGRPRPIDQPFHPSSFNASQSIAERRYRRIARSTPKALALGEAMKRHRVGGSTLPSSPVVGRSVLDLHRYLAHDATASTSDDSDAWNGEEDTKIREQYSCDVRRQRLASSEEESTEEKKQAWCHKSATGAPSQLPSVPPHLRRNSTSLTVTIPTAQRASSLGLSGLPLLADSFSGGAGWGVDAWADAELKATTRRQSSLAMNPGCGFFADEEDILIPMDLSAFDSSAGCSLL